MKTGSQLTNRDRGDILRYSNRLLFYVIWFGGALLMASSTLLMSDYDWNIFFERYPALSDSFGIFVLFFVYVALVIFLFPLSVALVVTDHKAVVAFGENFVEIHKKRKTITIDYYNITRIDFVNVVSLSKGFLFSSQSVEWRAKSLSVYGARGLGPYQYSGVIYTSDKKYRIYGSFMEAWQCRKRKRYPTIYNIMKQLEEYSGCEIRYITK